MKPRLAVFLALVITLAGLGLRLDGIETRVYAHPENFAPGVDVPDWTKYPPERLTLVQVLRSTMIDGHPPTYFIAMLPWVEVFGTSLFSLRLPSAILGAAAIYLLFLLGRREHDQTTGLVAALLLAIHGHAIYWSQMTRMYMPVAFLGLVSSFYLLRAAEKGRAGDYLGYFLATFAALWTQLYAWPLVVGQMVWCMLGQAGSFCRQSLRIAFLAVAAATPVIQLSIRQNPATDWSSTPESYFAFGYLYPPIFFWHEFPWRPSTLAASLLCLGLVGYGVYAARFRPVQSSPAGTHSMPSRRWDWFLAALVAAGMLLLAWRWIGSTRAVWIASVLPFVVVASLPVTNWVADWLRRKFDRAIAWLEPIPLFAILAVFPVLLVAAISLVRGIMVPRGTVTFLPYLLLATAVGLVSLLRQRRLRVRGLGLIAAPLVGFMFLDSIVYIRQGNSSPRDYASLASQIRRVVQPGDVVLVRNDYVHPPLFYYLDRSYDRYLVHDHFDEAIAAVPPSGRIWFAQVCPEHMGHLPVIDSLSFVSRVPFTGVELWQYERVAGEGRRPPPASCVTPPDSTKTEFQ
jgi:Dolichyl-phosphate-mannose-protein mannosyltransferase